MSEPKIAQKGPYVVEEKPGKKAWCACGHSQNQPYCDGSHGKENTGIKPIRVEITENPENPVISDSSMKTVESVSPGG